jgi:hypothetical protein
MVKYRQIAKGEDLVRLFVMSIVALLLVGCSGAIAGLSGRPAQDSRLASPSETYKVPATQPNKTETPLENYGPAPELTNEIWLNTKGPLRFSELRGKVVLLDMWTFG